jgi:cytochrome c-type biogenesis protein CcmF
MSRWNDIGRRLLVPGWLAGIVLIALVAAGVRNVAAVGALALAAFVAAANLSELVRGVRGFRRAHGGSLVGASARAVAGNRRLYGGLVAHLGLAVIAVAITVSSSFAQVKDLSLAPGATAAFQGYDVRLDGIRTLDQTYRRVLVADLTLSRDGATVGRLHPSLNLYPGASQAIGTPSLRVGLLADVYATLSWIDPSGRQIRLQMFLNPGTLWLWIGGAIILLGGAIAGWPRRTRQAVPASVLPEERELEVVR